MDGKITGVVLSPASDSRGRLTAKAAVSCGKISASAKSPYGTSAGKHEVSHLPEGELTLSKARDLLAPGLVGMDARDQVGVDMAMKEADGTPDLSEYGGATILAISMAVAKLAAKLDGKELFERLGGDAMPYHLGKCIGGGSHGIKNGTDIQEFLALPVGAKTMRQCVELNNAVHKESLNAITRRMPSFDKKLDYEGGWNPPFTNEKALEALEEAVDKVAADTGVKIRIGVDMASTEYFNGKFYVYRSERKERNAAEELGYVLDLIRAHSLFYVEDPFNEEDFKSHALLVKKAGETLVVGDDLFTTDARRLGRGIRTKAGNAIIIKPNQIGTVTDTQETVALAKKHKYVPVISHRSGETDDTTIAHMAVGWGIPIIKIGIVGTERVAKLRELVRISDCIKNPLMGNITVKN